MKDIGRCRTFVLSVLFSWIANSQIVLRVYQHYYSSVKIKEFSYFSSRSLDPPYIPFGKNKNGFLTLTHFLPVKNSVKESKMRGGK